MGNPGQQVVFLQTVIMESTLLPPCVPTIPVHFRFLGKQLAEVETEAEDSVPTYCGPPSGTPLL